MTNSLVENDMGRRRIRWPSVLALLAVCLLCVMGAPTLVVWLLFHDAQLVKRGFGMSLVITLMAFGMAIGKSMRLPVDSLPLRPKLKDVKSEL